jgi:Bacterial TniB protein
LGARLKAEDLSHLHAACREAARLSNDERIHWLRQERWIRYPRAERILERLVDLVDYPPRDRMPCLLIYGATGMGKTRIIEKFLRDNRSHYDKKLGKTRVPVVSIQMPPAPSERDLYEEILSGMNGVRAGTSITTLRHRIRALARQLEVRMLVIDPFASCWNLSRAAHHIKRDSLSSKRFADSACMSRNE